MANDPSSWSMDDLKRYAKDIEDLRGKVVLVDVFVTTLARLEKAEETLTQLQDIHERITRPPGTVKRGG